MSECQRLSDRMPAVVLDRAVWTPDETRHLESCPSCQEELELVRLASRLGEEVGLELDASATTRALLELLKETEKEERLRRRAWSFAALATAAAVAAGIFIGRPGARPAASPATSVVAERLLIPLPELDDLQPAELNAVLQTMNEPSDGGSADSSSSAVPDDEELDAVLDNTWEG